MIKTLTVVCLAFGISLFSSVGHADNQREPINYINSSGETITKVDSRCRPEMKIDDHTIMILSDSPSDTELFKRKLMSTGLSPDEAKDIIEIAQSSNCDRQSARNCSSGTCASGRCSQVSNGNFTFCRCK